MMPPPAPCPAPEAIPAPDHWPASDRLEDWGLLPTRPDWSTGFSDWKPGEKGARAALRSFLGGGVAAYAKARDFPSEPGTSRLSPHLHFGEITPAQIQLSGDEVVVHTPLGALQDVEECPLPSAYEAGLCDVLLRADDIVHDDDAPVKAQIVRKAFRGSEFLYTLRLASGETLMTHVPSHHNHAVGEWIGIRAEVDHVVTFERGGGAASPPASGVARQPVTPD